MILILYNFERIWMVCKKKAKKFLVEYKNKNDELSFMINTNINIMSKYIRGSVVN